MKPIRIGRMLLLFLFVAGCASLKPKHLEYPVYVYEQPFDLVYLRAYETLDANNDWVPDHTDKANGIIEFRSLQYGNLFDLDKQHAYFVVKMVDRKHTSVELDPSQSKCQDDSCLELLKSVDTVLSHLPKRKEKENQGEQGNTGVPTSPSQ